MDLIFGVGDGSYARQFERPFVFYLGDEVGSVDLPGFRLRTPQDVLGIVQLLFGDPVGAFSMAEATFHVKHPCGVPEQYRQAIVNEFCGHSRQCCRYWGNSTIDGLHGAYNVSQNASRIMRAPSINDIDKLHCPAIAVGAGPSLSEYIHRLPELRDKCLIVACDTVAQKLNEAGCDPHVVTPLERLNSTAIKLRDYNGDAIFAGMPCVPPEAVAQFNRHIRVSHSDVLYQWAGMDDSVVDTGSTSGSMAVHIASELTDGPVYMIGHDLLLDDDVYFDASLESAKHVEQSGATKIAGNDDEMHETKTEWARVVMELQILAGKRMLANCSAPLGMGARILGAESTALPLPAELPVSSTELNIDITGGSWIELKSRGKHVAEDFEAMCERGTQAKSMSDLRIEGYVPERNLRLFAYILRPMFAQISVERRLGKSDEHLIRLWRQRMANLQREIGGIMDDISHCFGENS
jgi:hypothetical protein